MSETKYPTKDQLLLFTKKLFVDICKIVSSNCSILKHCMTCVKTKLLYTLKGDKGAIGLW